MTETPPPAAIPTPLHDPRTAAGRAAVRHLAETTRGQADRNAVLDQLVVELSDLAELLESDQARGEAEAIGCPSAIELARSALARMAALRLIVQTAPAAPPPAEPVEPRRPVLDEQHDPDLVFRPATKAELEGAVKAVGALAGLLGKLAKGVARAELAAYVEAQRESARRMMRRQERRHARRAWLRRRLAWLYATGLLR